MRALLVVALLGCVLLGSAPVASACTALVCVEYTFYEEEACAGVRALNAVTAATCQPTRLSPEF